MAFEPELTEAETIKHDIDLVITKNKPLRLVLTDQAAYWPTTKRMALKDSVGTAAVPIDEIEKVVLGRKSALGSVLAGLGLALLGILWTLAGYVGAPQAFIIGGILLSISGGRRVVVQVYAGKKKLEWTSPLAFGKKVKTNSAETQSSIANWCTNHAVAVTVKQKKKAS